MVKKEEYSNVDITLAVLRAHYSTVPSGSHLGSAGMALCNYIRMRRVQLEEICSKYFGMESQVDPAERAEEAMVYLNRNKAANEMWVLLYDLAEEGHYLCPDCQKDLSVGDSKECLIIFCRTCEELVFTIDEGVVLEEREDVIKKAYQEHLQKTYQ